jgi:hypothetical protein
MPKSKSGSVLSPLCGIELERRAVRNPERSQVEELPSSQGGIKESEYFYKPKAVRIFPIVFALAFLYLEF